MVHHPREHYRTTFTRIGLLDFERLLKRYFNGIEQPVFPRGNSSEITSMGLQLERDIIVQDLLTLVEDNSTLESDNYEKRTKGYQLWLPQKLLSYRKNRGDFTSFESYTESLDALRRMIRRISPEEQMGKFYQFYPVRDRPGEYDREEQRVSVVAYVPEVFDVVTGNLSEYHSLETVAFLPSHWPDKPNSIFRQLMDRIKDAEAGKIPLEFITSVRT